jgi:rhamnosyltransferase
MEYSMEAPDLVEAHANPLSQAAETDSRIAALIVAYRDRPALFRCLRALGQQTRSIDTIIVVDNSETPILTAEEAVAEGIELVRPGKNVGLGAAFNVGFERAASLGHDWCWTFDQDSEPLPNALEELENALAALGSLQRAKVGIIASTGISRATGRLHRGNPARWLPGGGTQGNMSCAVYDCDVVLSAGSLTNIRAFAAVGGACKDFFIDWVDFELCVKLRRERYRILCCQTSFYRHQIGGKGGYADRSADRHRLQCLRTYTGARNAVDTVLHRSWGVRRFPYLLVLAAKILTDARESSTVMAACTGIWDGITKKHFGVTETLNRAASLDGQASTADAAAGDARMTQDH